MKSHSHYSCALFLCIDSIVLLISTCSKCKTFNKWDDIAVLWINLHQNSFQRYLKWISRLVDLLIIILLSAINISELSNSLVWIQIHSSIVILHQHYLFHRFQTHLWSISSTYSSSKTKSSLNIYWEYWAWKNIFSHLRQSRKIQSIVFSKLSCWTFLIYNISAKILIIFVLKRMSMLRLLKQWFSNSCNRLQNR